MTTVDVATKPATKETRNAIVNESTKPAQLRLTRRSPAYWRVTIDNPPINVMGPEMVREFQEIINAIALSSLIAHLRAPQRTKPGLRRRTPRGIGEIQSSVDY
jgi:hypothetical protein